MILLAGVIKESAMTVKNLVMVAVLQIAAVMSLQQTVYGFKQTLSHNDYFTDWSSKVAVTDPVAVASNVAELISDLHLNMYNALTIACNEPQTGTTWLHLLFTHASPQFLEHLIAQLGLRQDIFFKRRHLQISDCEGISPIAMRSRSADQNALEMRLIALIKERDPVSWCCWLCC
jgi:hypothetical protein